LFYVFQPDVLTRRGGLLYALIQGKVPQYPDYKPHWWDAEPLSIPISPITFAVHKKSLMPDNLNTANSVFDLYSPQLINLLSDLQIKFETFPATLIDAQTQEVLPFSYKIFHLLEIYSALDESQSIRDKNIGTIEKLVLNEEIANSRKLMFRVKESRNLVLVHEELKERLINNKITGCLYTPVERFQII
jgi:hypothetical protein